MNTILAVDLGKFKSVCCFFNPDDGEVRYVTVESTPALIGLLLEKAKAEGVVCVIFEACVLTGWVAQLCDERGLKRHIAATNGEAWRWKNVKGKTDRDDALKLARLYGLGELPESRLPSLADRQHRSLLHYRQGLVGRRVSVQNGLRALFLAQGMAMPTGASAWTEAGLAELTAQAQPLGESREVLWQSGPRQLVSLSIALDGAIRRQRCPNEGAAWRIGRMSRSQAEEAETRIVEGTRTRESQKE